MFIEVSLTINPINYLKICKYLEAVNWRISHVTKRQVKQPLTLSEKTIPILVLLKIGIVMGHSNDVSNIGLNQVVFYHSLYARLRII